MNICGYYPESINEGEGLRAVLFFSGCRHRCPGCFNPKTWNFNYGEVFTPERRREIIEEIAGNPLLDGLTLAGGDPFSRLRRLQTSFTSCARSCRTSQSGSIPAIRTRSLRLHRALRNGICWPCARS